jgi:hypothetical protein
MDGGARLRAGAGPARSAGAGMSLPGGRDRLSIVGRTGTGKTQAALWFLAQSNYTRQPWVVLDYKGDPLIADMPMTSLEVGQPPPRKPGLYRLRPTLRDQSAVEWLLWKIWERGNTGLFSDEGYMLGTDNDAFRAILTQGRSKSIPAITLSQRPVYMDRFAFSEANYYLIFGLNDRRDLKVVREFLHRDIDLDERLPQYSAWYHHVDSDRWTLLGPVPDLDTIRESFRDNLRIKPRLL